MKKKQPVLDFDDNEDDFLSGKKPYLKEDDLDESLADFSDDYYNKISF